MKRKLLMISFILSMLFFSVIPTFAESGSEYFIDETNENLTEEEINTIKEKSRLIDEEYGFKIIYAHIDKDYVSTVDESIALYEANASDYNGIILIINEGLNEWYVYSPKSNGLNFTVDDADILYDTYNSQHTIYDGVIAYIDKAVELYKSKIELLNNKSENNSSYQNLGPLPRLVDDADLLSNSEEKLLLTKLDDLSSKNNLDIVVVTKNTIDGKSPMNYADDFYDYHEYKPDGILLLISMEDRDYWMSTTGYGIKAFTDKGIEYISKKIVSNLSDGDYYGAFDKFADLSDKFIIEAKKGTPYDVDHMPKGDYPFIVLPISGAVGLLISFIYSSSLKNQLKSVAKAYKATSYIVPNSLIFNDSREVLVDKHVSKTYISRNNSGSSGGGGSSTHFGSSGVSHGGGGGKF